MRVRKAGATWVHERRADDTDETFVRTICGMSFTVPTAQLYGERWTEVTCPSCIEMLQARERVAVAGRAPATEFHPKTGETALAFTGPRVEVLTIAADGRCDAVVFVDGREVPCILVTHEHSDPARGDVPRDVTGDVTLSAGFRDVVAAERATVLGRAAS